MSHQHEAPEGPTSQPPRLFEKQRLQLERRAAYVRRVKAHGGADLDPVLRFHLGLEDTPSSKTPRPTGEG